MQQSFETDFWKNAEARKTWDDIIPGEPRRTMPYVLTLDAIHRYCRAVDRADRDLLVSVYHPDAIDDHGLFVGGPDIINKSTVPCAEVQNGTLRGNKTLEIFSDRTPNAVSPCAPRIARLKIGIPIGNGW